MKHRKTKLSLGLKIASILSCVAILSAGFAAWWIVQTPSKLLENGSFTVYTVTQKKITVTDASLTNANITFGTSTKTPATTPVWLLAKDTMSPDSHKADLAFGIKITDAEDVADNETKLNTLISAITITLEPKDAASTTALKNAINNGYITAPTITGTGVVNVTAFDASADAPKLVVKIAAPEAATMSVDVDINFGWGTPEGANPFDYYNGLTYTESLATEASALLAGVAALDSCSYKVTIGATLPTA